MNLEILVLQVCFLYSLPADEVVKFSMFCCKSLYQCADISLFRRNVILSFFLRLLPATLNEGQCPVHGFLQEFQ